MKHYTDLITDEELRSGILHGHDTALVFSEPLRGRIWRPAPPLRIVTRRIARQCLTLGGGAGLALLFFLVLPLLQMINKPLLPDTVLQGIDTAFVAPPPPPEPEPEKEQAPEEPPPELTETAKPLDLEQLELALNPAAGLGDGWAASGDFSVNLNPGGSGGQADIDALFSLAELDQPPRVLFQPGPALSAAARKKTPGTVHVLFIVDRNGRVEQPIVQSATDPVFETPALNAVKQWKFEPGKRNGQAVRFRMRVPMVFPKG